jgi:hypothetical protein
VALGTLKKLDRSKEILMGNGNSQMGLILEVDGDYVDAYILYAMCMGVALPQARPVWLSN